MMTCKAYKIFNENNKIEGRISEVKVAGAGPGEVLIRTAYSSVNYKDALAATGAGRIIRNFPLVGGIDAAGTVIESADERFRAGDEVICTSYDMGVAHDGGYAAVCRVPADWVVPLPQGLTLFEAMALGTAGYTAGLAVELLELNGMAPDNGRVLVNGATGGVASLAIDMLAGKGFDITALTAKAAQQGDFLKSLGASEILDRSTLDYGTRPLEKALWAAAFDSAGGDQLGWLTRTMQPHGVIASFGNAAGIELRTTVLPFILRGVRLIGIDSVTTPMALRRRIWARLAGDLKPRHLATIAHTIGLDQLPGYFGRMLQGDIRGRAVVRIQ